MADMEVTRTETADRFADVDEGSYKKRKHRQHVDRVLAVESVGEGVGTTELRVVDVTDEVEQFIHRLYI